MYIFAKEHQANDRDIEEIRKTFIYFMEEALKKGGESEEVVFVFNLNDFGMYCMDFEWVQLFTDTLKYNYPLVVNKVFVVDSPFIFNAAWAVIKPWVTGDVVHFIGQADLENHIHSSAVLKESPKYATS